MRGDHPFFGTLRLFARFEFSDQFSPAAADGRNVEKIIVEVCWSDIG